MSVIRERALMGAALAAALVCAPACNGDGSEVDTARSPDEIAGAPSPTASDSRRPAEGDAAPRLPDRIICGTQYRPDADTMAGATDPGLEVARSDDGLGSTGELEFDSMTLRVTYHGDAPDGRTVNVAVYATHDDAAATELHPIATTLYQLGDVDPTDIAYSGGHGFTGLTYVYHDGAMLQVWCRAERDS